MSRTFGTSRCSSTGGRLYARKGVDRVIQSLPRVLEIIGDLHYAVVGDGPYLPVLEDLARRLGVTDRIVFAGGTEVANRSGWDQRVEQFLDLCDRLMATSET